MSVDQTSLTVEILGNSSSAVEAAGVSQASLEKLTAAISGLTASFDAQNVASDAATAGVTRLSGAQERATVTTDALTRNSLLVARGADAMSLSFGAAATRAAAMTDALDRMSAATPGLLAIGAALGTLFAGFEFLKTGVQEASEAQNAMRELSIAATSAGQSTAGMTDKVQRWAAAMAEAAGISESQTIPAVLRLVDAGQSVGGAMTIATVAAQMVEAGMGRMRGSTDMAESSQMRYNQVLLAFYQAMDGNYTAISRVDPAIRKLVEAHAPLPAIIEAINKQTQDSIEKNNTNAQTWERVQGIIHSTGLEIGGSMLPAMTKLGQYIFGMVEACRESGKAFSALGGDIVTVVGGSIDAIGQLASALSQLAIAFGAASSAAIDFAQGNMGAVKTDIAGVGHAMGESGKWVKTLQDNLHRMGSAWNDVGTQETHIQDALNKSLELGSKHLQKQLDLLHQQATDSRDVISPAYKSTGSKGAGGAGAVPGASAYEEDTAQYKLQTQAESDLTKTTDALNAAKQRAQVTEAQLAANVRLATTSQAEAAAQQALNAAKTADAHQQVALLTSAISDERGKQSELAQTVANLTQTLNADKAAQAAHTLELAGAHKEALGTREATSQYAAAVHDAQAQLNDAKAALKAYTDAIKSHNTELAGAIAHYLEFGSATNEALAKISRDWSDFQQKQAQSEMDAVAKRQMTAQQYVAFLRGQYESDYSNFVFYKNLQNDYLAGVYEERAKTDEEKLDEEENAIYQQNYNNFKNVVDKMASTTTTFLDNVLIQHKTLRDQLKNVWNDILKDFVAMLDQMLAKTLTTSSLLQRLLGFGGGSNPWAQGLGGIGIGGGASPSGLGSAMGATGSTAAASMPGSAGAVPATSPLGAGKTLVPAIASLLGNSGGGAGGTATSTSGSSTLLSGASVAGAPLGGLALGAIGGDILSNILFHNNQSANIGGAVGGAGGFFGAEALLSNPALLGALGPYALPFVIGTTLISALAGGALGSLFGDHFPKANEPDIYNTQAWGQELADMQGSNAADPMIANGQQFVMDSSTSSQTQGRGWNVLIESFVTKFRQNQKALPQELQAGFPMLEELWGGAQNSPDFNGNGKNGMLQIGSGTTALWTTFWSYVSAYGPAIAQLMAMYQPVDLYAASLNGSVSEVGGYTPTGEPWLLHSFPDAGLPAGAASAAPQMISTPGGSKQTVNNVNVYQQFGGSLIADKAMDQRIYKAISNIPGFSQADLVGT